LAEQQAFDWSPPRKLTLEEQALEFIAANPHVLDLFIKLAREARDHGARRVGAKMLVEKLRWELRCKTTGQPYRLNNSFTSYLARTAEHVAPDLKGLFATRRSSR